MLKNNEVKKMLEAKYKIGDKVFNNVIRGNPKYSFLNTNEVIAVSYLLPFDIEGINGEIRKSGGWFEYTLANTFDGKVQQLSEGFLGKRRKQ
jgi:hypothetical protein